MSKLSEKLQKLKGKNTFTSVCRYISIIDIVLSKIELMNSLLMKPDFDNDVLEWARNCQKACDLLFVVASLDK